jgi:hypothetical protein
MRVARRLLGSPGVGACPLTPIHDRERCEAATDFAFGSRAEQSKLLVQHEASTSRSAAVCRIAMRPRRVDPGRSGTARRTIVRAIDRPCVGRSESRTRTLRSGGSSPRRADSRARQPSQSAHRSPVRSRRPTTASRDQKQPEDSCLDPLILFSERPATLVLHGKHSFPCHAPGS